MGDKSNNKVVKYASIAEGLAFALLDHARNRSKETQDQITAYHTQLAAMKLEDLAAVAEKQSENLTHVEL